MALAKDISSYCFVFNKKCPIFTFQKGKIVLNEFRECLLCVFFVYILITNQNGEYTKINYKVSQSIPVFMYMGKENTCINYDNVYIMQILSVYNACPFKY